MKEKLKILNRQMLIYNIHSTTLTKIHPTVKNVCKPYQNCLRNDIRNDIYTDTKTNLWRPLH